MKIGVVNDTEMAAQVISATLRSSKIHTVLWIARSGAEAIAHCKEQRPDLVLMDLIMPGLNGVETSRRIMAECPTAILVVTASVNDNCSLAFQAMGSGALDAIETPMLANAEGQRKFLDKIAQLAAIIEEPLASASSGSNVMPKSSTQENRAAEKLIAIGSSAGGPGALADILTKLPEELDAAVVMIQHIDVRFVDDLAVWLRGFSKSPLQLVSDGDELKRGHIYLAGKNGHLEFDAHAVLRYSALPAGLPYQPSVDVFFSSVVRAWKGRAMGVILTGMGRDGSVGLKAMRDAGYLTVAQDEATSALFGMPKAAVALGAAAEVLPLGEMASRISRWIKTSR